MIEIKTMENMDSAVTVPASKSANNRALLIAALADGKSLVKNVLKSEDTSYMIDSLKKLGVEIELIGDTAVVHGTGGKFKAGELFAGNSGTTMRFLTGAAVFADGEVQITGTKRMLERPISDLTESLKKAGVECSDNKGFPPVKVSGRGFKGGIIAVGGDKSSQYISSLLMIAPYAEQDTVVEVEGELASKPFVDLTIGIMKDFGVVVENKDYKEFIIKKNQAYNARGYVVEGDWTQASYFLAAAAVAGGVVKVKGLKLDSFQGDKGFLDVLEMMGCEIKKTRQYVEVTGRKLRGIAVDMNAMPDAVQTLAVAALFAEGKTEIKNVGNLRIKETDRIKALCAELRKLGADVVELKDGLVIEPGELHGAEIETYGDHRMAMSFAIAGLKIGGLKIKNPECVNKTFPGFWEKLDELR